MERSQDSRMWRLLRARLHPDAGGDPELFLFASVLLARSLEDGVPEPEVTGPEDSVETFLEPWLVAMDLWTLHNYETVSSFGGSRSPLISTRD